jgi:transcriptional/translational regulatory protein YebC/TACO1
MYIGDSFDNEGNRSTVKAIVFDLSAFNHIDASGLQVFVDVRTDVERWAGTQVQFYFAHVHPELIESIEYFLSKKGKQVGKVVQESESSDSLEQADLEANDPGPSKEYVPVDIYFAV